MDKTSRIFVAGADTLIGAAIFRRLYADGYEQVLAAPPAADLRDRSSVAAFFDANLPEYVFLAAGKSGGIQANQSYPADLMLDNLMVNSNVLDAARRSSVKKLLYVASSCCYPRDCPQPMQPRYLMTGPLEITNESYALAKLAGLKLCQAYARQYQAPFITAIPANPFGTADDFSIEDSHVIAALIRKIRDANANGSSSVEIWGTGAAEREFIFDDDLADACLFLMENYESPVPINIGAKTCRLSIKDLAVMIRECVGYEGEIKFDSRRPDGMPCKFMDSDPMRDLGWSPKTDFREALRLTYRSFLEKEVIASHA